MSNANSDLTFEGGGRTRALTVRRMTQAKRMRLSIDPRDGGVRLVIPYRAALRPALNWAETQRDWVEGALAALPPPQPILPGATIPFDGGRLLIDWSERHRRTPRREDDRLLLGGAVESVAPRVLRWLRGEAVARLTEDTRRYAGKAGVEVGRVSIGDPRARWGSCSAAGDIRYSWRLVLTPAAVREATVAHEVAHRIHMHHGPAFHEAVADLLGRDPREERGWLRRHGPALYWLGRDS